MCVLYFSSTTLCVSMGKALYKSQNMSRNGVFRGKHHPVPAVHCDNGGFSIFRGLAILPITRCRVSPLFFVV